MKTRWVSLSVTQLMLIAANCCEQELWRETHVPYVPNHNFSECLFFWGGVSDKYTQRIFMVCLVSQNMSVGGLIHSYVILKVLGCPCVFKLVCRKMSKFALEN